MKKNHPFNVGDTVEVIDADCTPLVKGQHFVVLHADASGNNIDSIGIDPGQGAQWFAYRFKLVKAAAVWAEEKPPLGLRLRYIAEALRIQEILSACMRYTEVAKPIPALWLEELAELTARAK